MTYEEFEKESKIICEDNKEYIAIFKSQLMDTGLSEKTISAHISNVDFFLNVYNTLELDSMEDGCRKLDDFLGYYFIRKCMWSTPATIKSTAASLKKFYKCMLDHDKIDCDDLADVFDTIKMKLQSWAGDCAQYNDEDEPNPFLFDI